MSERELLKIVLTYNGLIVNAVLLQDKEWVADAISHKDDDGESLLQLSVYPHLTGQVAIDAFLSRPQPTPEEVREACAKECEKPGLIVEDIELARLNWECATTIRSLDLTKITREMK